jgi:hypothetical protein
MSRQHNIGGTRSRTPGPTEVRRGPRPSREIVPRSTPGRDRAVAVASQVDGLEHAVPLDELASARTRGQWPQALCDSTVVPGALGALGRECRSCRRLVQAAQRRQRPEPQRSWWRRLLFRH